MGHMGSRQGYSGASLKPQDKGRSPGTLLNLSFVKNAISMVSPPIFSPRSEKEALWETAATVGEWQHVPRRYGVPAAWGKLEFWRGGGVCANGVDRKWECTAVMGVTPTDRAVLEGGSQPHF